MSKGYGLTQKQAEAIGSPHCPKCGLRADAVSEHYFFMWDVVAARCTPCRLWTVMGWDGEWLERIPGTPVAEFDEKYGAMARAVYDRKKAGGAA